MEASSQPMIADVIVVSDVHLREANDQRGRLFRRLLQQVVDGQVGCLILTGDIFDFCLGSKRYFRSKFALIGSLLEQIAQRGTRVIFVEGNHEFDMLKMGWRGVEVVEDGDVTVATPDGITICAAHGDLVYGPASYRWFRALVKSRLVRLLVQLVPPAWMDAYALGHARVSRAADVYRTLDHQALLKNMNRWADRAGANHVVFGHFHVAYAQPRVGNGGLILSVESWQSPNVLRLHAGQWQRSALPILEWNPVVAITGLPSP